MTQKVPQKIEKIENMKVKKTPDQIRKEIQMFRNDLKFYFEVNFELENLKLLSKLFDQKRNFEKLEGRDEEYKVLEQFVQKLITSSKKRKKNQNQQEKQNVLLVEGMAGIGKTFCVRHLQHKTLNQLGDNQKVIKFVYVNTKKLKNPTQIYKLILNQLTNSEFSDSSIVCKSILQKMFQQGQYYKFLKPTTLIVLVIDQVESLDVLNEKVIYNLLVYWPRSNIYNFSVIFLTSDLDLDKKIPIKTLDMIKWSKLTFSPYQPKQLQRIIKQRLKQGDNPNIFQKETIQFFCQQFAKRQIHIKKFLYLLRETISRNIEQSQNQSLQQNFSDKYQLQSIPSQKLMEVLMQKCQKDTFSDDFKHFPKPYKIVLACIAQYFQKINPKPKHLLVISFKILYQTLRKVFIREEEQLRHILYDLQDLKLLKIQYRIKKQHPTMRKGGMIRQYNKRVEDELVWLQVDLQQVMTARNKDESMKQLLVIDFQFPKTALTALKSSWIDKIDNYDNSQDQVSQSET